MLRGLCAACPARTPKDLQPGMVLEGVVTNVAAFGAFVDLGVHQDGLVDIPAIANAYVKEIDVRQRPDSRFVRLAAGGKWIRTIGTGR